MLVPADLRNDIISIAAFSFAEKDGDSWAMGRKPWLWMG